MAKTNCFRRQIDTNMFLPIAELLQNRARPATGIEDGGGAPRG